MAVSLYVCLCVCLSLCVCSLLIGFLEQCNPRKFVRFASQSALHRSSKSKTSTESTDSIAYSEYASRRRLSDGSRLSTGRNSVITLPLNLDGTHATTTTATGEQYTGDWLDGMRHGQGRYVYGNGDQYIGTLPYTDTHASKWVLCDDDDTGGGGLCYVCQRAVVV